MSSEKDDSPSIPPPLNGHDGEKRRTLLFVVIAAVAILALVFVTAVLALVLWKAGFFASRSPSVVHIENTESKSPASSSAPVLHIRSKSLNVLDGKSLVLESTGEVRSEEGYLVISDSETLRLQGPITVSAWFK